MSIMDIFNPSPGATPAAVSPVITVNEPVGPFSNEVLTRRQKRDAVEHAELARDAALTHEAKMLNAIYMRLTEYYNSNLDPAFTQNFMITPTASKEVLQNPEKGLEHVIKHGLITTNPNIPDELLSPEAVDARTRAVQIALQAAYAIQVVHARPQNGFNL